MTKDLTVGKPLPVLVKYTLPLFAGILFQQFYTIADSFVAGRWIGTDALAAVGNSYEVTLIFIAFAFGCNIGTSVSVAKHFGEKDMAKTKSTVSTSLLFALCLGTFLTVAGFLFTAPLLRIIKTPQEIFVDSSEYLYIYIVGYLFLLLYNVSTGIFSALGDSKTPFIFLSVSSVSNVGMDILFVTVFDMGVSGVAWATFLCQGVCGSLSVLCALVRVHKLPGKRGRIFDRICLRDMLRIAVPSILQQSFVSFGNIIIQGIVNSFGTVAIGGYAAAVKLNNMAVTSMTAVGNGMSNYTAQNLGAGKADRIRRGFFAGLCFACSCALLFILLYLPLAKILIGWFISDGSLDAVWVGCAFLFSVSPFYLVIAVKLIADGVLRGVGKMGAFMIATLIDLVIRVVFSAFFAATGSINAIWWSWPIGWVVALFLSLLFACLYFCTAKQSQT